MSDPKYQYQTLQLPNQAPIVGGPSARGAAVGAGVKLLHKASQALNGWAVSHRVNQELEKLAPKIEEAMVRFEEPYGQCLSTTGALVVVGTQEWAHPDPTGARAQTFLSIHVGGAGNDAKQVLQKYLDTPRIVQGAPRGWRRKDTFIWVSRRG